MTIEYRILVGDVLSAEKSKAIHQIISDTFHEVDTIYNKWNPFSEISQLNQLKANEKISISLEMEKLLLLTDQIVKITDFRFDPTIEPLQDIWKKHLEKGTIPSDQEIQHIKHAIGWDKIHFNNGTFYKDEDLTSLDLGGIAKGYCVDLLVERLKKEQVENIYVEWGGEIRTSGIHPDQRPWTVFICCLEDPNPKNALAIVKLKEQAIATSGDYLQNWTIKGEEDASLNSESRTYFHILDSKTLKPVIKTRSSVASASVLASTCAFADALATASMLLSTAEEAREWMENVKISYPEVAFWIISREDQETGSLFNSSTRIR